jgi:predicted deacetylase
MAADQRADMRALTDLALGVADDLGRQHAFLLGQLAHEREESEFYAVASAARAHLAAAIASLRALGAATRDFRDA